MRNSELRSDFVKQAEAATKKRDRPRDLERGRHIARLRVERLGQDVSQAAVADMVGVSLRAYQDWEAGYGMDWRHAKKLGELLAEDPMEIQRARGAALEAPTPELLARWERAIERSERAHERWERRDQHYDAILAAWHEEDDEALHRAVAAAAAASLDGHGAEDAPAPAPAEAPAAPATAAAKPVTAEEVSYDGERITRRAAQRLGQRADEARQQREDAPRRRRAQ